MKSHYLRSFSILALLLITSCGQIAADKIEEKINTNLEKGDPRGKVISFMDEQGWTYSWDDFAGRYQAIDPEETDKPWLGKNQIQVYINENDKFVKANVHTVYNF